MSYIVIGNIIMLAGSCAQVLSGFAKTKKTSLIWQTIQNIIMAIGGLVLGSIPCAIITTFMTVRNILEHKNWLNEKVKAILIISASVISVAMNNCGWIGLIPIIAFAISTMGISTKDVAKFKAVTATTCALFFVNDVLIKAYTSAIFNIISIGTNLYRAYKTKKAIINK